MAPMTLIGQWTEEAIAKTKVGSLRVHMYYGDKGEGLCLDSERRR